MMSPLSDLMSCLAFFVPYLVITAGSPKLQTTLLRVGISENDSRNGPDEISARGPVPAPPDGKESGVRYKAMASSVGLPSPKYRGIYVDGVSTGGGPSGLGPWVLGIERASERDDAMDAAAARLQEA
ncbi:hypothetical protein CCUS01_11344 [Colletotrichum cuscutae]|uniref:Uncharacterized protein n=1 Tax=Colletotrichum cuscutae TaxID=1209917 RepID=A0AAI9U3G3_9PEZI|nr:hypothetical protein CCUS01_11344 [Colletotrichum cuscutae]